MSLEKKKKETICLNIQQKFKQGKHNREKQEAKQANDTRLYRREVENLIC